LNELPTFGSKGGVVLVSWVLQLSIEALATVIIDAMSTV